MNNSNHLIAVSNQTKQDILSFRDHPQIDVIPNGIDTDKFFPDKRLGASIRQKLGVTDDTPLVLYAARVDPMKGHQTVISVAKLCPDIQFIFAGKGTEILDVPKNVLGFEYDLVFVVLS